MVGIGTVINIHNPHYLVDMDFPIPVQFFKKVVLALPQGEIPLRPSCKKEEFLDVDQALAVNCRNILIQLQESGLPVPGPFEGFLVIEVPPQTIPESETPELDVVAIYTARHRTGTSPDVRDYDVQTMDVEKVEPRRVIGEPMSKRHMQS